MRAAAWCGMFVCVLSGCTYQLRGRVVQGDISYIAVVDADDERLNAPPLAGAALSLETDPEKINRKSVGRVVSDAQGMFSIPVDEIGAGLLEYDMGLSARRKGYENTESFFRLPSSGMRILVVLHPGKETPDTRDEGSLQDQARKFSW